VVAQLQPAGGMRLDCARVRACQRQSFNPLHLF
jgi:hypothetical protein